MSEIKSISILMRLRDKSWLSYRDLMYASDNDDIQERDHYLARWTGYNIAITEITGNDDSEWMRELMGADNE